MTVRLNPYLSFAGTAREAMTFYQSVFGGELSIMEFSDIGQEGEGVMHAMLESPALALMGADMPEANESGGGFSVSLSGDEAEVLRGWWDGLAEGATINEPLVTAPWGDTFGMLTDRFGVNWMVNITAAAQG